MNEYIRALQRLQEVINEVANNQQLLVDKLTKVVKWFKERENLCRILGCYDIGLIPDNLEWLCEKHREEKRRDEGWFSAIPIQNPTEPSDEDCVQEGEKVAEE